MYKKETYTAQQQIAIRLILTGKFTDFRGRRNDEGIAYLCGLPLSEIQDLHEQIIRSINPQYFIRYLKNAGWKYIPTSKENVEVLQKETKKGWWQVNVPVNPALYDYEYALLEAINQVADVQKITAERVYGYCC